MHLAPVFECAFDCDRRRLARHESCNVRCNGSQHHHRNRETAPTRRTAGLERGRRLACRWNLAVLRAAAESLAAHRHRRPRLAPRWRPTEQGLRIAATCKIAELDGMAFPANWIAAPLVNQCCRSFLASFKIWNAATVGGNLCMALPAGPMISLTAALDGVCVIWTPEGNQRRVPVTDFVLAPQRNALRPGELLRAIDLPLAALRRRTAFRQIALSPLGRSGALLIGTRSPDDGAFLLTVTAATPRPVRLSFSNLPSRAALRDALENDNSARRLLRRPAWRASVATACDAAICRRNPHRTRRQRRSRA